MVVVMTYAPATNDIACCTRKRRYFHKQDAKQAARRTARQAGSVHAYECNVCGHWHVSTSDPAIERERRNR